MNGATYNQLQIFHAIVQAGSLTQAARHLEVAPASVSQALKALEKQLGLPLFTRSTRHIELTEAGQLLHERTLTSMSALNLAVESVSDLSNQPSGKVRITMPHFVYHMLIKPIYVEFCQRYPAIELEISLSDATVDIMREGFDMGIRFGEKVEAGMVAHPLTSPMDGALAVSPAYVDQFGLPQTPDELKHHKAIQYRYITSNHLAPIELLQDNQRITVEMPRALVVNDTYLVVDAALNGLGIGQLMGPVFEPYFASGELIPVLPDYWTSISGVHVYFHQHSQKAKRVRALVDFLLEKRDEKKSQTA